MAPPTEINTHSSEKHKTTKVSTVSLKSIKSQNSCHGISTSQMREINDIFQLLDHDDDERITKNDLVRSMCKLHHFAKIEELQEILQTDVDGDYRMTLNEFIDLLVNLGVFEDSVDEAHEERELKAAFHVFDKHNHGYIRVSDIRAVLQCLDEDVCDEEIEEMIKEVDINGDGLIDFNEFIHALSESFNQDEYQNEQEAEEDLSIDIF